MLSLAGRLTGSTVKEVSIDKLYKVLEMTEVDGSDRRQVYSLVLRGFGKSLPAFKDYPSDRFPWITFSYFLPVDRQWLELQNSRIKKWGHQPFKAL